MLKRHICSVFFSGMLMFSFAGYADNTASSSNSEQGRKLIESLTNGQAKVRESFQTDIGLTGFVIAPVQQGGQEQVVFAQQDQYLIIGNVITAQGKNLTQHYTEKLINSKKAKEAYQQISKLHWIAEGSDQAKHKLYVIFDPNCIYCHLFYKEVNKLDLIKNKMLQIRWLPVGFLKKSSAAKAAAMFHSPQPVQAIVQDENAYKADEQEGGLKPLKKSSDDQQIKQSFKDVEENTQFFSEQGFGGTPTLLYKQSNGKYGFIAGFVKGDKLKALVDGLSSQW